MNRKRWLVGDLVCAVGIRGYMCGVSCFWVGSEFIHHTQSLVVICSYFTLSIYDCFFGGGVLYGFIARFVGLGGGHGTGDGGSFSSLSPLILIRRMDYVLVMLRNFGF